MRPFVPRALTGDSLASVEQSRFASRIEDGARQQGYHQGESDGIKQGLRDGERAAREELEPRIEALEAALAERIRGDCLTDLLRDVLAGRSEDRKALEKDCASTIEAALRLVFPVLMQASQGREAVALLQKTMLERDNDILEVRASPTTMQQMRAAMMELPQEAWTRLRLLPDPALDAGAADISWCNGGLTYNPAILLAKIAQTLRPGMSLGPDTAISVEKSLTESSTTAELARPASHPPVFDKRAVDMAGTTQTEPGKTERKKANPLKADIGTDGPGKTTATKTSRSRTASETANQKEDDA